MVPHDVICQQVTSCAGVSSVDSRVPRDGDIGRWSDAARRHDHHVVPPGRPFLSQFDDVLVQHAEEIGMGEEDDVARRRASEFAGRSEPVAETSTWSVEARAATRATLDGSALAGIGDRIAFKNRDGHFALLADTDLLAGRLRLVDRVTSVVSAYPDVDALLDAGWAVD